MTDEERKAMRRALDALEDANSWAQSINGPLGAKIRQATDAACDALEAALDEPPAAPQQEGT